MFNERELTILLWLVDKATVERPASAFRHAEFDMLAHSIHNMLKATRLELARAAASSVAAIRNNKRH